VNAGLCNRCNRYSPALAGDRCPDCIAQQRQHDPDACPVCHRDDPGGPGACHRCARVAVEGPEVVDDGLSWRAA